MYNIFYLAEPLTEFPNAIQVHSTEEAQELSRTRYCWILHNSNNYNDFDLLYEPKPWESKQVHVWPSQFQEHGGTMLVPKHHNEGNNYNHSIVPRNSGHDIIFVDHCNVGSKEQYNTMVEKGFVITKKRTVTSDHETMNRLQETITKPTWIISSYNDNSKFDFNWHPDEYDTIDGVSQYFGTQHQGHSGTGGIYLLYHESKNGHIKVQTDYNITRTHVVDIIYIDYGNDGQFDILKNKNLPITKKRFFGSYKETLERIKSQITKPTWIISSLNDYSDFDFTWYPIWWNETDEHTFPSQHYDQAGTYWLPGGQQLLTRRKLEKKIVPRISSAPIFYIDYGNKNNDRDMYDVLVKEGYDITRTRYYDSLTNTLQRIYDKISQPSWVISSLNDNRGIDFTWHPDIWEEGSIHKWCSQYQKSGGTYYLPVSNGGIPEIVFRGDIIWRRRTLYPIIIIDYGNDFEIKDQTLNISKTRFFGTIQDTLNRIHNKITEPTWIISSLNDYSDFDFKWHPNESQTEMHHVWGDQHQRSSGTYLLQPGEAEYRYHKTHKVIRNNLTDIIVIDYGNKSTHNLTVTNKRFFSTLKETLNRIQHNLTKQTWVISSLNDYSDFDFSWHPADLSEDYIETWPSQHQTIGGTFLLTQTATQENPNNNIVPRTYIPPIECIDYNNEFELDIKFHKARFVNSELETLSRLHKHCNTSTWVISSLNDYSDFDFTWHPNEYEEDVIQAYPSQHQKSAGTYLLPKYENNKSYTTNYKKFIVPRTEKAKTILINFGNTDDVITVDHSSRFIDSYYGTLNRVLRELSGNVWVVSSVCDYSDFDFTWHPDISQDKMLHVFPSNDQKYGDTFYINVNEYNKQAVKIKKLEWFEINFLKDNPVSRYPLPVIEHDYDSQVDAVKNLQFNGPLALYSNSPESCLETLTVSLWRPETRTIVPLNKGGSCVIVPKDALNEIKTQLYDYKYINKNYREQVEAPIDIVFICNGEANAEEHFKWLLKCTTGLPNKVMLVSGINGRLASMREAAKVANTPWYFVVNAKLKVNKDFNWNWQPDRLQEQKHYIFYANNPYTGDTYGHMAIVAHNKELVNTDVEYGLDFVMSFKTAVVPILSGDAEYADTPWDAWRTAFRETLKLIVAVNEKDFNDFITEQRIDKWLNANEEWNKKGANDAKDFYNNLNDKKEVFKSYEWGWLKDKFDNLYSHWS